MARSANSRSASLLRVSRQAARGESKAAQRTDPTWLLVAIAAGVVLSAALVLALIFGRSSTARASAEPAVDGTVRAASMLVTSAGTELAPRPTRAVPARPAQLPVDTAPAAPLASRPKRTPANETSGAQSASFKPVSAYPQNIANRPIPRIGEKPWLISEEWRAHHERQLRAPGRASAKLVFLGDSITEGWGVAPAYREYFGKYSPLNLGIANDTTQNVLWRIEHGALDGTNPQALVLMIGINNLAGGFSPEQTADGVRAIIAAIQTRLPAARLLLLGILPARQDAGNPLRQAIKDANRLLQSQANPGKLELHDLGSVMLEPDGSISKSTMRDFVHPTAEGFERLSQAMAPFLDALLDPPTQ